MIALALAIPWVIVVAFFAWLVVQVWDYDDGGEP